MAKGFTVSFTAITSRRKLPSDALLRRQLDSHTHIFALQIAHETSIYPPVPSDRYTRTHDLEKAWRVEPIKTKGSIGYTISNYARDPRGVYYSRLVHGPAGDQLNMHRSHGWRNITDVMTHLGGRPALRAGAQYIIDKYVAGV